jgi:two-component system OmpR family sensor kinase
LRLRLTLLALVALMLGLLAGGIVVPVLVERFLTDRLDEQLTSVAVPALRTVDPRFPTFDPSVGAVSAMPVFVERRNPDGQVEVAGFVDGSDATNAPRLPNDLAQKVGHPFTVSGLDSGRYRVLVATSRFPPRYTYAVALPLTEVDATVRRVITIEVITISAAVVGVALLAWWLIGLGLRPLRSMEATAASIAETGEPGQGQRIPYRSERTELGQLASTLNTMLDRIDESFEARRATEGRLRRFAADASHELRTPLTSIRGYAELYRHGGDRPEQVERSMSRIEDEATRMSHLVEDLLTITRLDEGRPLEHRLVDLAELASKAVADARVVDPERPIELETPGPVVVDGDPNRLMQVLVNLVGNACVHTPPGTRVEVAVAVDGTSARIEVRDHGPGLTADQATQVFDRFYRADPSRSRAQGGSGLGLAIVDAVVRAHGGQPSVVPTPGGGATFRVLLPLGGSDSAGGGTGGAPDELTPPHGIPVADGTTQAVPSSNEHGPARVPDEPPPPGRGPGPGDAPDRL